MAGTPAGGRKAVATQISKIGYDAYKLRVKAMGRAGGFASRGGGFASRGHDYAVEMGKIGGTASRRNTSIERTVPCNQCYRKYVSVASLNSHRSRKHSVN